MHKSSCYWAHWTPISPQKSSLLLHFFCQGQVKDLHEGANHSNIDGSRMNVQRDLACVACFQSHLCSLKNLWLLSVVLAVVLTQVSKCLFSRECITHLKNDQKQQKNWILRLLFKIKSCCTCTCRNRRNAMHSSPPSPLLYYVYYM